MTFRITLGIQTSEGSANLELQSGSVVLIAGPNGVGKSALLYQLYRSLSAGASYLPGHRQINFNNGWESIGQDITQLKNNLWSHFDAFNRYKGHWSEDQFKSTVRSLLHAESAFNRHFRQSAAGGDEDTIRRASTLESPLDTLNVVFRSAGLPVQFTLSDTGLSASREGSEYSIEALSDGERASLFLASAIITQAPNNVLLVDEPEKHLHPSITGVLIETALRSRPDIAVVVSSHDVNLIERLHVTSIVHVRNSILTSVRPEQRQYELDIIQNADFLPDELKRDLLGARSKMLFIEGTEISRDIALYNHVYPGRKILPKGGHEKVMESVRALRGLPGYHWLQPSGLIDRDGRSEAEVDALRLSDIFVLPFPTVENLFFLPEIMESFVEAQLKFVPGPSYEDRLESMRLCVSEAVLSAKEDIVARRVCWTAQRALTSHELSVRDVKAGRHDTISISVSDIASQISADINNMITEHDPADLVIHLPIKNTDIPEVAAKALGAKSFKTYTSAILRQLDLKSIYGEKITAALRSALPLLPETVGSAPNVPAGEQLY